MATFFRFMFLCLFALLCLQPIIQSVFSRKITETEIRTYRERVHQMFYHAYDNYMQNAYPYDELRPLSCDGVDTWGSFSLTLIDVLDTLAVMGNYTEFRRVAQLLIDNVNFDMNINVSVFETNIRVVGGLLSAHLLSYRAGMILEPGWPCSGPLLRLAEDMAHRLLPAFESDTGMPYGTVNLHYGVPQGETAVTCTAGVGTYIVEFGTLSRLTGNPAFENAALKAMFALWHARSPIGLVGNHIDVMSGKWTAVDSGIGAGVDSYYEYLVKGSVLLQKPELMSMFNEYRKVISRYMMRDDWYMWVNMQKGQVTSPVFQSLEAYWPGLLTLVGDIDNALKAVYNYHQVWKQFGFTPEFYNIPQAEPNNNREGYPLRPELVESLMYIYKATKDPFILKMGIDILESIQHSARTPCGYATIKDVRNHMVEDRMESFFLAETTKYLYLLFDPDNFVHANGSTGSIIQTTHGECIIDAGGYIFNTEAHPIDVASVYCCGAAKEEDALLQHFHDSMDILALLGLQDGDFLKPFRKMRRKQRNPLQVFADSDHADSYSGSDEGSFSSGELPYTSNIVVLQSSALKRESLEDSVSSDAFSESANEESATENREESASVPMDAQSSVPYYAKVPKQNSSDVLVEEMASTETASDLGDSIAREMGNEQQNDQGLLSDKYESIGVGKVTYLGDITDPIDDGEVQEEDSHREECAEEATANPLERDVTKDNVPESSGEESSTRQQRFQQALWSGTKPLLSNVQRDTLYSSGFLGVTGIGLMGIERNNSIDYRHGKIQAKYEVLVCPAQPFTLRFSIMGELFGAH